LVRDILSYIAAVIIALGTGRMVIGIGRRQFISALGGAAAAWPLAARAQTAMPVIGFLSTRAPGQAPYTLAAFRQSLKEAGYIEGQNVAIKYRYAENQYDRLQGLAADLVRSQVAVIVASGTPAAPAVKAETTTIPIVFVTGVDPVEAGLVASLGRPGGNLTGVTGLGLELEPKRLELMHELMPTATTIAVLINRTISTAEAQSTHLQAVAHTLGLQVPVLHANSEHDFDAAFAMLRQLRADALIIGNDPFFISRSEQLAGLALRYAVPAIYEFHEFAAAGGLMSYGSSLTDLYSLAGIYTGRILKGAKPADLPVQQSTKVELIINLKTARTLGVTIPLPLLGRADEVIE
jgi:putative tryptophan/tyrosine transport system substrate-binding protein